MEINKNTSVEEIVRKYPKSIDVFKKFNMEVIVCGEIVWDSLGELCEKHGVDFNSVLIELKKLG